MSNTFTLYRIIELSTFRTYVGCTSDFTKRRAKHLRMMAAGNHVNGLLQAAYNRSGPDGLMFQPIGEFTTLADARSAETAALTLTAHDPRSLNLTTSRAGAVPSPDTRRRISATLSGRRLSAEHRAKLSEKNRGRPYSEATRRKIGEGVRAAHAARTRAAL